jgi:hypothetical protein
MYGLTFLGRVCAECGAHSLSLATMSRLLMAMLTGQSCRALVAQALPLCYFVQVLSLSLPSIMSCSEGVIFRAR